jgi:hypothetical protein
LGCWLVCVSVPKSTTTTRRPEADLVSVGPRYFLWERACSRRRRYIQHRLLLTLRLREQARSHIGFSGATQSMYAAPLVGSGLAREESSTSSIFIDWHSAFASRLAPTGGTRSARNRSASGRLVADVDLERPVNHAGRTQALRSGQPGMDAGLAALGHGWPFAAGPRSNAGVRAHRA